MDPNLLDISIVDALARSKISKPHFLKDLENYLQEVTHLGLEPLMYIDVPFTLVFLLREQALLSEQGGNFMIFS